MEASALIEENTALRKQLLQLHIQNAMITNSLSSFQANVTREINRLVRQIPSEGTVSKWLSEANAVERDQINGLRDECVVKLKELKNELEV